jgi:hypothetical protein
MDMLWNPPSNRMSPDRNTGWLSTGSRTEGSRPGQRRQLKCLIVAIPAGLLYWSAYGELVVELGERLLNVIERRQDLLAHGLQFLTTNPVSPDVLDVGVGAA